MVGDAEDPVGVAVHLAGALALLEKWRHLQGPLVVELDVAVVEPDSDDISEGVVAQAEVLSVLVVVLNLEVDQLFKMLVL